MEYVWAILLITGLISRTRIAIVQHACELARHRFDIVVEVCIPGVHVLGHSLSLHSPTPPTETLESFLQARYAGKYGASTRGNIGGIIGAVAGATPIFAPLLSRTGALMGALGGAYLGCLIRLPGENARRTRPKHSWQQSLSLGFTVKTAIAFGQR